MRPGDRLGPYEVLAKLGEGGMGEFYAARVVVPLDGSPPRPVPDSDVNEQPVQWSDDSQSLFVFRPGEIPAHAQAELYLVNGLR